MSAASREALYSQFDKSEVDSIDWLTFEQVLEMDDDEDDRDFSKGIVFGFFDQAEGTFVKIEQALKEKDLPALSALGHFLKGSSATLGLSRVRDSCEKMQHYGSRTEEDINIPADPAAHAQSSGGAAVGGDVSGSGVGSASAVPTSAPASASAGGGAAEGEKSDEWYLDAIQQTYVQARKDYAVAAKVLKAFYSR